MDIFAYLEPQNKSLQPGEWVEKDVIGKKLTFDEICQRIGKLIVMDKSTASHEWYKVVLVEKIVSIENGTKRMLVYFDGTKQRGFVNERYFDENYIAPARAWELAT